MAFDALRSTFRRPFSAPMPDDAGDAALTLDDPEPVVALPAGDAPATAWEAAAAVSTPDVLDEPAWQPAWQEETIEPDPVAAPAWQPAWQPEPAPVVHQPAPAPSTYQPEQFKPVFDDPIAGGDVDNQAFTCPGCGRTLDRGVLRCEGCGQRFLFDIPAKRAGILAGGGALAAIVATLLLVNVFAPPKPASAGALGDPSAAGSAGSGTGSAIVPVDVPSAAMAALRGTVTINERLAAEAPALRKALDAKSFKTSQVVKILRRMAIDARTGAGMLRPMGAWDAASGHQAALQDFYRTLGRQIEKGLAASVKSAGAYKKAAKQVIATLRDAPQLDASARTLATASGIELPAADFPSILE